MHRRAFLSMFAGGALAAALSGRAANPKAVMAAWAEGGVADRRYFAGRLEGPPIELPARGHALVAHPHQSHVAYACARRPGAYLIRFDVMTGSILNKIEADEAHRFEGHAVTDGKRNRVLATESELDHGQGRIGIYDGNSLERLGEWSTHGVGPHELLWLDTDVLAVANGGILTLPETGRVKRNIENMEPSLVLLDAHDGRKLDTYTLLDRKLSIRHLAVAVDGTLSIALQYESAGSAPVLALLRKGVFATVEAPRDAEQRIGNYAAAVAACGDRFAVTCTRGDCVAVWDTHGRYCGAVEMRKPSGVVSLGTEWLVSNEFGDVWRIRSDTLKIIARSHFAGRFWDNHISGC